MTLAILLDHFQLGQTIYLPGATGEILALADALAADPERMDGVHIVSCLIPGMNAFDYAGVHANARLTSFLFPTASRASSEAGRVRVLPLSYFAIARYLQTGGAPDVAIAHLAPPLPGEGRLASVGIAADFTAIAWEAAKTRIAFVNPLMPAMKRGPRIDLDEADHIFEGESSLVEVAPAAPNAIANAIARQTANLVPDGAYLQVGIGSAPAALWAALSSHRNLRLRSGLASEELLQLADNAALAGDGHIAGILAGTCDFYRSAAERDLLRLSDTLETHDPPSIGQQPNFIAANSALSVDLFGQTNLEWQGNRPVSGVGGAPDFASAALASPGGRSIAMLPSTARKGTISRIVQQLDTPTVSLPRNLADVVISEHGVANLRDASADERAEALIAIADPAFREGLSSDWRALRASASV